MRLWGFEVMSKTNKTDSCKTTQIVVTENAEHVVINIQRKNGDLSQPLEVKCTSFTQVSSKVNDSNVQYAVENEDYVPIDEIILFLPGEQIKVLSEFNLEIKWICLFLFI